MRLIKKDELAQAVAGCDLDPLIVREGKEGLFEERWYGQVFTTADPDHYLPRYWLMREVSYAARGFPERAYAKWVTLSFAWQALAPLCRRHSEASAFREACERDDRAVVQPLRKGLDAIFVAALRFYRTKRGTGATAIDVSTFFKRRNRHQEFARFWRGSGNSSRRVFNRAWLQFSDALKAKAAA
jgi:hypothetical protein